MYDWHTGTSWRYALRSSPYTLTTSSMLIANSSILVLVKSLARLLPHPPRVYHSHKQTCRPVLAIARFIVQDPLDAQTRVETDQVGQRKRAHGMAHSQSKSRIDVFGRRDTLHSGQSHLEPALINALTFSSTRMASLSIGMRMALAMKPGLSLDWVTSVSLQHRILRTCSTRLSPFLHALPNAFALCRVSDEVWRAGMTSTNFLSR